MILTSSLRGPRCISHTEICNQTNNLCRKYTGVLLYLDQDIKAQTEWRDPEDIVLSEKPTHVLVQ